ncbi:MFS transporter [Microbacterium sp. NPDC089698]|uniref:MFS transporter n=1 Tax=Microbacterium sp. NPDC089698 TaxID=3364200 RepID=UPI0037FF9A0E
MTAPSTDSIPLPDRFIDQRPGPAGRSTRLVAVLAFAGIVVSLMQSLLIPLLPELPRLLSAPPTDTTWAVTATLLAGAVATPTVGRLGDMFGKRRMLLISVALLIAGSVIGAVSTALVPLIIGRVLQGLAAGVIPLGISIMRDELPVDKLGGATATMSASLGVGGALGLPAAALIADYADWHVLFWVSAALGIVAFVMVATLVPESPLRSGGRFDVVGAVGVSGALASLLLAVSKGSTWGWSSPLTVGLLVAAAALLALWVAWELKNPAPLVDLRVTARRQVLLTNLASLIFGFAMFAMSLVLPQLLQAPTTTGYGLGQPMLVVGLVMAPSGLVMMAVAPLSARISRAAGAKVSLMIGAAIVAAGYGLNIMFMSELWHIVLVSMIIGAGIGLAYGAMPALIMAAVPMSETAAANSLNTLMRSIGTSISSAVAGVILAQMVLTVGPTVVPTQDAFRIVLAASAASAVVALTIAAFLPRARSTAPARA